MRVIDASAIAKYVLRDEHWELVRDQLATEPCSLDLALAEVANAIWKHQVIYGRISAREASLFYEALRKLGADVLVLEPFAGYLTAAIELGIKEKLSIYDALYLVQAQKYGSIVTSDEPQRTIAVNLGLEVVFIE